MAFPIFTIREHELQDAQQLKSDLGDILKKIGIKIDIKESSTNTWLSFEYDIDQVQKKMSRGAGATCKNATTWYISVDECRKRMEAGETAASIAAELGIGRTTLFRRLKKAEQQGLPIIYIY